MAAAAVRSKKGGGGRPRLAGKLQDSFFSMSAALGTPDSRRPDDMQLSQEELVREFERLQSRMKMDLAAQADIFKEIIRRPQPDASSADKGEGQDLPSANGKDPAAAAGQPGDEATQAEPKGHAGEPNPHASPASAVVEPGCGNAMAAIISKKSLKNAAAMLHLDSIGATNVADYVYHEILDFKGMALKATYNLHDRWGELKEPRRTGKVASFVKSGKFEMFTLTVVILNCLVIIQDQNENMRMMDKEGGSSGGSTLEAIFGVYFLCELVVRLSVHRWYFFVNDEMGWNIVDTTIVGVSTLQILQNLVGAGSSAQLSFLRSFRVLKLARVLRLVRMVKIFSDLRVMVIAFLNSCLALFWCMVLLIFTLAMFALVFVQLIGDFLVDNRDYGCDTADGCIIQDLQANFGSVQRSMLSLYMATTGGNDWAFYFDMVAQTSDVTACIFVFYTAFYYFGVFNLLTGMFVDKAVRASQPDQDMEIFAQRLQEDAYIQGFMQVFDQFDLERDGLINDVEYHEVIKSDQGRIFLGVLGLSPTDTRIVFDALSRVQKKVPVKEFVQGCLRMKGGATSIDMHSVQFEIQNMHTLLHEMNREILAVRHEAHEAIVYSQVRSEEVWQETGEDSHAI